MLNNNFSYTQLSFFLFLQKDFYFNHNDTDAFFCCSSERFWYLSRAFFAFFNFSFSGFDMFHLLLSEAFLCVFDNVYLPFWYIQKSFQLLYIEKINFKNYMKPLKFVLNTVCLVLKLFENCFHKYFKKFSWIYKNGKSESQNSLNLLRELI